MTFSGWVQVRGALDLRMTVVTVVVGAIQAAPTDVVSVAFRLQHAPQAFVEYAGPATVLYSRSRLTVAVNDHVGWTFVVTPVGGSPSTEDAGYPQIEVHGLAFFWGARVHDTEATVFDRLALSPCLGGSGDQCTDCVDGGLGATHCTGNCGDGECQATCGAGFWACCKCPLSCACCSDIGG